MQASGSLYANSNRGWRYSKILVQIGVTGVGMSWVLAAAAAGGGADPDLDPVSTPGEPISFNQQIRPILSENCFACHGPDAAKRKADLRLDSEPESNKIWSADSPELSEALRRITSDDPEERMPPPDSGDPLAEEEIRLLSQWVSEGAQYEKHWAFRPIQRPALPKVQNTSWIRNPIDHFILARLESLGLQPSPEASISTLKRRLALDLNGLPRLANQDINPNNSVSSERTYDYWVQKALNSPAFGEHLAGPWLDAARYADSNGYQNDGDRDMWRWRDWVIEALNSNMALDDFTIQQIAGDLLPNADQKTKTATAFHRLHRYNSEGGSIPEETLVENAVDRVSTTGTVWLGMTLGCARCHDHKYDPISQKEFYQLFSFFNNITETGRAMLDGNSEPFIAAPTDQQIQKEKELQAGLDRATGALKTHEADLEKSISNWRLCMENEIQFLDQSRIAWVPLNGSLDWISPDPEKETNEQTAPKAQTLEWSSPDNEAQPNWIAPAPNQLYGLQFQDGFTVNAGKIAGFSNKAPYTIALRAKPDHVDAGALISRMHVDETGGLGYSMAFREGHFEFWYVSQGHAGQMRFRAKEKFQPESWYHVAVTYDGRHTSSAYKILVNGIPQDLEILLNTDSNPGGASSAPLLLGSSPRHSPYQGALADIRLYNRQLSSDEIRLLAEPASLQYIKSLTVNELTKVQNDKLRRGFLDNSTEEPFASLLREQNQLSDQLKKHIAGYPTLMVMEERNDIWPTFLLDRGEYDRPTEKVGRGSPDALHPFQPSWPRNRLGLAYWLVDKNNPLTARVVVNQYWQNIFGQGLVRTPEDFGSQGSPPSHPELLDWLAAEFMESSWDIKELHRLIVTSATYRQSSNWTPELLETDPENIWLARYPRRRLSARQIRDQALYWAGLLNPTLGGPPAYPEQPTGLWSEVSRKKYNPAKDANRYRRSLYTVWKRTLPPPNMMNFDAADRESCRVESHRTNTPLQALTLLNDPTYTFTAREMGRRVVLEGGADWNRRVPWAYMEFLNRAPSAKEISSWLAQLEHWQEQYTSAPESAATWLEPGQDPERDSLTQPNPSEWAAAKTFSLILLNLDEAITQE